MASPKTKKPRSSTVPYGEGPFPENVILWCNTHQQYTAFIGCTQCETFPCSQLTPEDYQVLYDSELVEKIYDFTKPLTRRRTTMYIGLFRDGSMQVLEDLDPNNPDPELLRDIREVYQVSRVLEPVVVLRPKAKEERQRVVAEKASEPAEESATEPGAAATAPKTRRKK